jgi:hypothetical protein
LQREKELGSTMVPGSGSPPIGFLDVEVPEQYMISRVVRNSRDMFKNSLAMKWEWLIR